MSQHDATASLQDMMSFATKAVRFCENKSFVQLEQDEILQMAIVRAVELVGEAASRVPSEIRAAHSGVPWQEIVATRNRLIHGYDRVDLRIIWDTIQDDLPPLIETLRDILRNH